MNLYYQSLIDDLSLLIEQQKFDDALRIIQQELSLPYVERDVLEKLHQYEEECLIHQKDDDRSKNFELEKLIKGTEAQKEKAVSLLQTLNLRSYEREVQQLLSSDLLEEFKGELIEALMEQKIDTAYHMVKDGLDITFVPSSIVTADQDMTVQEAGQLFEAWFLNDEPTLYNFCMRLLEQEIYEMRPFDLEELDPLPLAKGIVRLVYEAMGQTEELAHFLKKNGLEQVADYTLSIEKRGDNHEM